MNEKLINTNNFYQAEVVYKDKTTFLGNFSVYSDAERYALNPDNHDFPYSGAIEINITEIETKTYIIEKTIRKINLLAPKPDIVMLEDWIIHPHEKGPYLSGLATNHPKWPTIPRKGMSTGHIIGKKGELIVTETGTKYDLQAKNMFDETIKKTLLTCLAEI